LAFQKSSAVAKIRQSFDQTLDGSGCELLTKGDIHHGQLVKSSKCWRSPKKLDDAIKYFSDRASKTLRNIRSIYVKELEAAVENGKSPNTASTQKSRSTSKNRERVGAKRDSRAS
jgi:hypothetical protein